MLRRGSILRVLLSTSTCAADSLETPTQGSWMAWKEDETWLLRLQLSSGRWPRVGLGVSLFHREEA